jgi:hypothetical protein
VPIIVLNLVQNILQFFFRKNTRSRFFGVADNVDFSTFFREQMFQVFSRYNGMAKFQTILCIIFQNSLKTLKFQQLVIANFTEK